MSRQEIALVIERLFTAWMLDLEIDDDLIGQAIECEDWLYDDDATISAFEDLIFYADSVEPLDRINDFAISQVLNAMRILSDEYFIDDNNFNILKTVKATITHSKEGR